eukprot:10716483-Heterocapsa_arctica.AAC.1
MPGVQPGIADSRPPISLQSFQSSQSGSADCRARQIFAGAAAELAGARPPRAGPCAICSAFRLPGP